MSRKPSCETELKTAKRLLNEARRELNIVIGERNAYRMRSANVDKTIAAWRNRFDALLRIMPANNVEE